MLCTTPVPSPLKVIVPLLVIPVAPLKTPLARVAVPSVRDVPCTAPVLVIAPLAIVPIPLRFPELNPQFPVSVPSVMVFVPRSNVVTLAVVYVEVVPSKVVMVPVLESTSPVTVKLPVMLLLPFTFSL